MMSEKFARELFAASKKLSAELNEAGWIAAPDSFDDDKSPIDLFTSEARPLVVGLFGGTGAGKSSLLNRLAGADIARTGVVRPTSMEITAYLHQDVSLDALPAHFDTESFSANTHSNSALAEVMWVDMPDFDSDETDNKDQVLQWLPHIDLLLYVVTPERYKDAEGWRMMLANGYRHAWLFVINQWDRADPVQYADFKHQLEGAGFASPQIFRTVCVAEHAEDQFEQMVAVIQSLSKHNIVEHLQERGWMQRLERSRLRLQKHEVLLSEDRDLIKLFKPQWQEFEQTALAHLDRPFKNHSMLFAEEQTGAVSSVVKSITGTVPTTDIASNIQARQGVNTLWDDWLDVRCRDSVQQFQLSKDKHGVPNDVFATHASDHNADNASVIARHLDLAVDQAIKSPGTPTQRAIAKASAIGKVVLPLLACVWVAWRIVNGFIGGADDRDAYVGFDFLINGLLLAGLGWLIPWGIERAFVPSLPESVYLALHKGLKTGLQEIEGQYRSLFQLVNADRSRRLALNNETVQGIDQLLAKAAEAPDPMVSRVLKSAMAK